MKILALDTATKTGWAICRDGKIFESGVQDFSKKRGESNGIMFLRFRNWLGAMMDLKPDVVAYERPHHRGGPATEIAVNLAGRVQEVASEKGIEYGIVQTTTLKKWATGMGNASKEEMMVEAGKHLGRTPIDDNEADAVLIALWAWEEYGA